MVTRYLQMSALAITMSLSMAVFAAETPYQYTIKVTNNGCANKQHCSKNPLVSVGNFVKYPRATVKVVCAPQSCTASDGGYKTPSAIPSGETQTYTITVLPGMIKGGLNHLSVTVGDPSVYVSYYGITSSLNSKNNNTIPSDTSIDVSTSNGVQNSAAYQVSTQHCFPSSKRGSCEF